MLTRQPALSTLGIAVLLAASLSALAQPPGAVPAAQPKWTFPAPLEGKPPAETWLPHALSNEGKQHRADADRALLTGEYIDSDELENAGILQDELKQGQYDDMQSQLDALLQKFLADPANELTLQALANFAEQGHAHGRVSDTALLAAWVKARPNSAWAHYSRGLRWLNDAWAARGSGWAKDVSDAQWKVMQDDEVKARTEAHAALKIEPKLVVAWLTLLAIDRDSGALDKTTLDFNRATKAVPGSYLIADAYEVALEPRWSGSAAMMDDFAQSKLADLDKNPRFWDLQGDAAADSGCAACNDYHWDVSLKQYNAALVYADRPSWLEAAGRAALHVHRYALANAYYQRVIAMKHTLPFDSMYGDFAAFRCDPYNTAKMVEQYRYDEVRYAGMDDDPYPLGPDACVVYRRELPWSDEPLPDTSGVQVYVIDPLGHPRYTEEPRSTDFSAHTPLVSADRKWQLTVVQGEDKVSHVQLLDQKTGKQMEIFASKGFVRGAFNSTGRRLFLTDTPQDQTGGCRYYDPWKVQSVNIRPMVLRWAADQHLAFTPQSVIVSCSQFINDDMLTVVFTSLSPEGKQLFQMFIYDAMSGRLIPKSH